MVPVLKTGVGRLTEGSNPSLSAMYSNSSGVIFIPMVYGVKMPRLILSMRGAAFLLI